MQMDGKKNLKKKKTQQRKIHEWFKAEFWNFFVFILSN